ncbi:uncharacterized protein LOC143299737 [Babylonia areolata]|uniref:uncharacterized protein LOC143299737 n=1 Tax=Babylonia areolata TaxID=304850 RepID=UPI003FD2F0A3
MARRVLEQELKTNMGIKGGAIGETHGLEELKTVKFDSHFDGVYSLQYNFDGSLLAAGFSGGGVILYNPRSGEKVRELRDHRHGGYPVMCLRFHPKVPNLLYVATAEGHIYVINTDSGEGDKKAVIEEDKNEINTMDFSVDGFDFCTCGKDLAVRVYDTKTNKERRTYEGYGAGVYPEQRDVEAGNTMRVYSLKFSQESEHIFLTTGWDNHVKIWDIRTNDGIKRQIRGPHVCGEALDIQGNTILTGSWCANHALQEWDYREGKLIRDLNFPHKNGPFLYCAEFANKHTVIAGGSGTNSMEVIDRGANKSVASVKMTKPVMAMDSANDGELLAVGGKDNVIKMCALKQ